MLICTMLMIEVIIMMITRIIMMTMRSKRKKTGGGVGEGSFFCTDLSMSKRKTTETGSTYR